MTVESTLLLLLAVFLLAVLVFLRSLTFQTSLLTEYELQRRIKNNDPEAIKTVQRESLLPDILALRSVLDALLIVCIVLALVGSLGWFVGVLISVLLLIFLNAMVKIMRIHAYVQKLYQANEGQVTNVVTSLHPVLRLLRQAEVQAHPQVSVHSREELLHIVSEAGSILTSEERHLLLHAMKFEDKLVSQIMIPRSIIDTIDKSETLGPIVLDRLHKSGHSRFPVIDKDFDHVVGLLYSHDLIKHARSGKKVLAEKAMEQKVFYINQEQTLQSALAGFLKVKHHLFIVVNEFEETTGIVTIEDVLEALIGHRIIDEFDQHDDLRAVAKRAASKRNKSDSSTHISRAS